ncbi:MerR family transcriptional regulator [candidate division KSB1 bacterium]|nr:MerR family transcriptional regulator [candidate division KSB1 bacterium]
MKNSQIKKLYYSISEVSQITSLKKYVLRFWETEFSELKPSKNRAGNRIYRISDIRLIFLIKKLLYIDKYTIEGAKQQLKKMRQTDKRPQMRLSLEDLRKEDFLYELKKDLSELKKIIEGNSKEETEPEE